MDKLEWNVGNLCDNGCLYDFTSDDRFHILVPTHSKGKYSQGDVYFAYYYDGCKIILRISPDHQHFVVVGKDREKSKRLNSEERWDRQVMRLHRHEFRSALRNHPYSNDGHLIEIYKGDKLPLEYITFLANKQNLNKD